MRLHRLEVTAFGPFSGTVTVDFDRLSDAGLFLLSGATGAGKTSVLDAVCFALYGDVPGDRSTAKRLRADQAAPDLAPRVELEATLSSRRFRIVRTPAWQRPKRRGHGTTPAQASVHVAERVRGEWVTLATRLDEAGLLVSGLVGMSLTQFTQVAMLPQGRFQTFLRARSEERHRLLHQLFRTGRFESVESWLRERRITLRRQVEAAHRTLADTVSRTSEAVAAPLPAGWDVADLAEPATEGTLTTWAAALVDDARLRATETADAARAAGTTETAARERLEQAREVVARRTAVDRALAERTALDERAAGIEAAADELDAARRASSVTPIQRLVTRAETALAAARSRLVDLEVDETDRPRLVEAEAAGVERAATIRAALPREQALADLVSERVRLERRVETLETAAALTVLSQQVAQVDQQVQAALARQRLDAELAQARAVLAEARSVVGDRREELYDVHQRRIEGMAAELAVALAVGAECPVCGSDHHPHKATPNPGAPDETAEREAKKALADAALLEHAHSSRVHDLTTQHTQASERAGDVALTTLREQLSGLRESSAALVAGLDGDRPDDLESERASVGARLGVVRERHVEVAAEIAALLDDTGADDLAGLLATTRSEVERARSAVRALDEVAAAEAAHAETREALEGALDVAGFGDAALALAAARTAAQVDALATQVRDHERRSAAVAAVLDAPGVDALLAEPLPDLPRLTATHAEALDALALARSAVDRWSQRATRLTELAGSLASALEVWRPLHEEWRLVAELSAFCEGKAADNRLQMRLSAYVLAFRLSQVVAAANERLGRMSDRRYTLEHAGRAGAGETRGGLSLRIRDDWSGEARDPATLSGGETFVVSLALALGLADVITQEAGGADVDTLFVDEGFGALDADTLDDVLDTLDSLRDGGRVVGLVSHVPEMRHRIPTQLVVHKSRTGSTVSVASDLSPSR